MTIVGRHLIGKFLRKHPSACPSLSAWLAEADAAEWKSAKQIKGQFRSIEIPAKNQVVFNINGGILEIVVLIRYQSGVMLVQQVGTNPAH